MATELKLGWFLELIPRDPPPEREGLVLVGHICMIDGPLFGLDVGAPIIRVNIPEDGYSFEAATGFLFRLDASGKLCVREVDRHLFEVGRTSRFLGERAPGLGEFIQ